MNDVKINLNKEIPFGKRINSIFTMSLLQLKTLFSIPMMMFVIFGLPTIVLLGLGVLLSETAVFIGAFGLVPILIVGLIFGFLYYSSSKSTLHKNHLLTNMTPKILNFSIFFTILVVCFLSVSTELTIMIIFTSLGWVFSPTWAFLPSGTYIPSSLKINWSKLPWFSFIYFWLMTIILSYLFFSMFRVFFKDNQIFSMFVFSFFLYTLCFGHVTGVVFDLVQDDGQLWSKTFKENYDKGEIIRTIRYDSWSEYASFLTPVTFLNETFFTLFYSGATPLDPAIGKNLPEHFNFFKWSEDPSYNYALLLPYVYLIGMFTVSFGIFKDVNRY